MFGILTNKGQVPYVSLDDFVSIDKMKYFETYFDYALEKFCDDLPRIVEKSDNAKEHFENMIEIYENKENIPFAEKVYLFNNLMSTWYGWIERDKGWKLIKTYVPEFIEYLHDNVVDNLYGFLIKYEIKGNPMEFHRDWGPDTYGDLGLNPTEEDSRGIQETWIWFRFSDTKKLYVSDTAGRDDISKRIPMKSYGAVFNGLDYHGCYDGSSGFSARINGGLKQSIIHDEGINISTWKEWYPPNDYWKEQGLTL
jgi:hypothetical protein